MNVIDALRHHLVMRPYDMAVIHPAGSANYQQLAAAVSALAQRLRGYGIGPGRTVALYVSDPFLHLALALAAMLNGTITVSGHPNYDPIPDGAGVDVYLTDRGLAHAGAKPQYTVSPDWFGDAARDQNPRLEGPGFTGPDAICRFYTSSGTTGTPKVIAYRESTFERATQYALSLEPITSGPNLCMMWLSTIGGFGTAYSTLWHGATLVLAIHPLQVLRSINLYKVRMLRASPQQVQGLVDIVRGRAVRFPSLERIEIGGASSPASLLFDARATLTPNVAGVYGSTEAGLIAKTPAGVLGMKPTAAGYIVPGVEVVIVDEAGNEQPRGTEGIIKIRTPWMADGYVGDEAATAASFRDGWFYPGDAGRIDPDGLLHITGRTDEMINAGGVKLSPVLVDDFLLAQPGVREAAAFAFRQPGRPDQVWAAVVCGDDFDEQAVLAAGRAKLNSRAPMKIVRMAQIPRNAMGKPLRQQLSDDAARS